MFFAMLHSISAVAAPTTNVAATMRPSAPISNATRPKIQIAAVSRSAMASDDGRSCMAAISERH